MRRPHDPRDERRPRSRTDGPPRRWLLLAPLLALGAACGADAPEPAAAELGPIYATTYPVFFMAGALLGEAMEVVLPLPPGQDPAHWEPPRAVLQRLQRARLILVNGAGAEPWLESASLPRSRIVDTTRALGSRLLEGEQRSHRHGPAGEHTHAATLPCTWVDPSLMRLQLEALAAGLAERLPEHAAQIAAGRRELDDALRALEADWKLLGANLAQRRVVALSDDYVYPAARYGFTVEVLDPAQDLPEGPLLVLLDGPEQVDAHGSLAGPERVAARLDTLGSLSRADARAGLDYLDVARRDLDRLLTQLGVERP